MEAVQSHQIVSNIFLLIHVHVPCHHTGEMPDVAADLPVKTSSDLPLTSHQLLHTPPQLASLIAVQVHPLQDFDFRET